MGENQSGKMRRMARSAGYTGTSSRHESAVSRANRRSIGKMAVEPLRGSSANAWKRSTIRNVSTVESSARAKPCCNKLLTTVEMSSAASVNAIVYKHANGAGSTRSHSAPKTMPAMTDERGS